MIDYSSYSAEELAADPSFGNWVLQRKQEDVLTWEAWVLEHPERKEVIATATALVGYLNMPKHILPIKEIEEEIRQVHARIAAEEQTTTCVRPWWSNRWWQVAAVFAGLLLTTAVGYLFYAQQANPSEYATQYGEIKEVILPDGSLVTLSGNSHLRIDESWLSSGSSLEENKAVATREVWLDGMAYFKVKHLSRSQTVDNPIKFVVHAAEVNVEVIGTEFNVFNRAEKVKVVLNSGRIQLRMQDKPQSNEMVMKPGELMELEKKDHTYQLKQVDSKRYTTWKDKDLQLEHTSLADVASLIEEAYGYPVIIRPEALKKRELTGTIQNRSLDFMLNALATLLNIEAYQKDKQIILNDPTIAK